MNLLNVSGIIFKFRIGVFHFQYVQMEIFEA